MEEPLLLGHVRAGRAKLNSRLTFPVNGCLHAARRWRGPTRHANGLQSPARHKLGTWLLLVRLRLAASQKSGFSDKAAQVRRTRDELLARRY